jgi:CRP/FNR family transcriptional regulator
MDEQALELSNCDNRHWLDFYHCLRPEQQKQLLELGVRRTYSREELIFQAGSSSDDVFILLDGRVKIFQLSCDGREVILWFCFPGEIFGLAEMVCSEFREINALACSAVELITIKQADFRNYLLSDPHAAFSVIELMSGRLRELGDVLLNLASEDVRSRVIKLLTRLTARYGKRRGQCIYLSISLTHQEMADMVATSRQTVTTVLGDLRRSGVLRTEQRNIVIVNNRWEELLSSCAKKSANSLGYANKTNVLNF